MTIGISKIMVHIQLQSYETKPGKMKYRIILGSCFVAETFY
jgi:hypothetical protein